MLRLVGCQCEGQCAGSGLEPTTCGGTIQGCAGSGYGCRSSQIEFAVIGLQDDVPVTAAEIVGVDAGDLKRGRTYSAVSISAERIILCQNIVAKDRTLRDHDLVVCLVGCQREGQCTGSGLEPAGGHCVVYGNTGICQG